METPCPGACSLCHPRQHMRCARPIERPPHPYPSRLARVDHGPRVVSPAQPCARLHSARSGSLSNAGGADQLIPPALTRVFTVMACPLFARSCGLARPRSALVTTVLCATEATAAPGPEMRLHLHGLSSYVRVDHPAHVAVRAEVRAKSTPNSPAVTHHADDPGCRDFVG
jgi:hypothetical protein